jgi:hypothetical protein
MNPPLADEQEVCVPSEGCNCPDGTHKWEIEPHPYSTDYDVYVGDNDAAALQALRDLVESKWDDLTPGVEAVIKIRMNHD